MTGLDGTVPAWWTSAECNTGDAALLDVMVPDGRGNAIYRDALAICRRCPVIDDCREDALATESGSHRFGMRGGLTPAERVEVDRRRREVFA
jgi:WhiB family redox-sensing transcriptional regulator